MTIRITLNITADLRDFLGEDVDRETTHWQGREADPAVVARIEHTISLLEAKGYEVDVSVEQYRCSGATEPHQIEPSWLDDGSDIEAWRSGDGGNVVEGHISDAFEAACELPWTEDELVKADFEAENTGTDGDVVWFDADTAATVQVAEEAEALFDSLDDLRKALNTPAYRVLAAGPHGCGPIATSARAAWAAWVMASKLDEADVGSAMAATSARLATGSWMNLREADVSETGGRFWRLA